MGIHLQADLIRLGAKYSPCMRREPGLWELIEEERRTENGTGCCACSMIEGDVTKQGSPAVRFCKRPSSVRPYE
ncbi:Rhomboid [Parelaphostrongylus tenuis]|uniref:Rhomboid n=1 Tax=Parelaphostrongylus tenuis TaxID=148309 RepID=A0AAD5MJD6_PARTN|nr:Rhomboid [Parelaphostrongylus tenuis]